VQENICRSVRTRQGIAAEHAGEDYAVAERSEILVDFPFDDWVLVAAHDK
jgi:hypothetical protein